MASTNPINLSKIKKQLARKNIRLGGKLIFNKDASNKIFQLCKTANQKFLILSFQNNPSEFLRYLRADKVLESQGLLTPRILEENKSLKYLLMDYYPTNNSSKYFKREEIKRKQRKERRKQGITETPSQKQEDKRKQEGVRKKI